MAAAAFRLNHFSSYPQRLVLRQLASGDQLAIFPDWKYRFRQNYEPVTPTTVDALVQRQWITAPGFPLFDGLTAGTITDRGRAALERWQ
jgi:hypothetical protein